MPVRIEDIEPAPAGPPAGPVPTGPGVHSPAQPSEQPQRQDEEGGLEPPASGRPPAPAAGPTITPGSSRGA